MTAALTVPAPEFGVESQRTRDAARAEFAAPGVEAAPTNRRLALPSRMASRMASRYGMRESSNPSRTRDTLRSPLGPSTQVSRGESAAPGDRTTSGRSRTMPPAVWDATRDGKRE